MLKKSFKRYIIEKIVTVAILFFTCQIMASDTGNVPVSTNENDIVIKPLYVFENKGNRDPFISRANQQVFPQLKILDISALKLYGIMESEGRRSALFGNKSGNSFGYILKDGEFYEENNNIVPDVKGDIKSDKEVLLIQGDKEILFKLQDTDKEQEQEAK